MDALVQLIRVNPLSTVRETTLRTSSQSMRLGFSLVELLVVIAITVILSAIAVPSFVKYGRMAGSDTEIARRELFSVLRAAKMYALTFRTDTGVAYAVNVKGDSFDGVATQVLDGYITVRRATSAEADYVVATYFSNANGSLQNAFNNYGSGATKSDIYVALADETGRMGTMKEGTCVLPQYFGNQYRQVDAAADSLGVAGILVVDATLTPILPRQPNSSEPPLSYAISGGFPAHVFQPSGILRSTTSKARVIIEVSPTPDQAIAERYSEVPDGTADNVYGRDGILLSERLEIYTTIGRIKFAENGGVI